MNTNLCASSFRLFRSLPVLSGVGELSLSSQIHRLNLLNSIAQNFGYVISFSEINKLNCSDMVFYRFAQVVSSVLSEGTGASNDYTLLFQNFHKGTVVSPMEARYAILEKALISQYRKNNKVVSSLILWNDDELNGNPINGRLFQERKDTVSYNGENFKVLTLDTVTETLNHAKSLASRRGSLSADEVLYLESVLDEDEYNKDFVCPSTPVFGEIYPILMSRGYCVQPSGINDFLKLAVYMTDNKGDMSLSNGVKIKLKNAQRRFVLFAMNSYIKNANIEKIKNDMRLKREMWLRFSERMMAMSDRYCDRYPLVAEILAGLLIDKKSFKTVNAAFTNAMVQKDINVATSVMMQHPGMFARNLDYMIRSASDIKDVETILSGFTSVSNKIGLEKIFTLRNHFEKRSENVEGAIRRFNIKSTTNKTWKRDENRQVIEKNIVNYINDALDKSIQEALKSSLTGSFYIDPLLYKILPPSNRRGASTVSFGPLGQISQGSRVPMQDCKNDVKYLRTFVWWIGKDVDLSTTFLNEKYETMSVNDFRCMTTHIKGKDIATHSGDVRSTGPSGGAEFTDIDIEKALSCGARYAVMNLISYAGGKFSEFPCFAGYMALNEIKDSKFNVKDVEMKMELVSETTNYAPIMFDLKTKEVIYLDIQEGVSNYRVVDIGNTKISIYKDIAESSDKNYTIGKLLEIFAKINGKISLSPENADHTFSRETTFDTLNELIKNNPR